VYQNIGFISGERNREAMFPDRSVGENVFAGRAAKGKLFKYLAPKVIRDFARGAVEEYNIVVGSLRHPANSLSGGNQQKLVVARWLATNPTLLLLDDPTKGVDVHSRREIHKILRQCADDGMTVMISSSENEELLEIADRIYLFYEGRVSGELSGASKTPERLVAAMMGMTREQNNVAAKEAVRA
jgi:ribose transport system ATP-binding protein